MRRYECGFGAVAWAGKGVGFNGMNGGGVCTSVYLRVQAVRYLRIGTQNVRLLFL